MEEIEIKIDSSGELKFVEMYTDFAQNPRKKISSVNLNDVQCAELIKKLEEHLKVNMIECRSQEMGNLKLEERIKASSTLDELKELQSNYRKVQMSIIDDILSQDDEYAKLTPTAKIEVLDMYYSSFTKIDDNTVSDLFVEEHQHILDDYVNDNLMDKIGNERLLNFQKENNIPTRYMDILLENNILKNDIKHNVPTGSGNKKLIEFAKGEVTFTSLKESKVLDKNNMELAKKINNTKLSNMPKLKL